MPPRSAKSKSTRRCSITRSWARSTWPSRNETPSAPCSPSTSPWKTPRRGSVKLAGKVTPDPVTGQLTTTFTDNPQLPFEELRFSFFEGARAPLRTPARCGTYVTTTALAPWSAPAGQTRSPEDSFAINSGPAGAPAPSGAARTQALRRPRQPHRRRLQPLHPAPHPPRRHARIRLAERRTRRRGWSPSSPACPTARRRRIAQANAVPSWPGGARGKLVLLPGCLAGRHRRRRRRRRPQPLLHRRQGLPRRPLQGRPALAGGDHPRRRRALRPRHRRRSESPCTSTPSPPRSRAESRPAADDPLRASRSTSATSRLNLDRPDFTLNPTSCDPMSVDGHA